jgi:hypothetical protein
MFCMGWRKLARARQPRYYLRGAKRRSWPSKDGLKFSQGARDMTIQARYLEVDAGVRYWEDTVLNGSPDEEGQIPLRQDDRWVPVIDLKSGKIAGWPEGSRAQVHYKVCDDGAYWLLDENGDRVLKWKGHYVPDDLLCVGSEGYGDYIIFTIGVDGFIEGWRERGLNHDDWELV